MVENLYEWKKRYGWKCNFNTEAESKKDYAVGIYAREVQAIKSKMDSLSAQISGLSRLAAAHRALFVADVFIDVGSAIKVHIEKNFSEW